MFLAMMIPTYPARITTFRISGYLRRVFTADDNVYLAEKPVCGMIDGNGFLVRLYISIPLRKPNRNV